MSKIWLQSQSVGRFNLVDLIGFLDPKTTYSHGLTVISCFYSANDIDDEYWICWGDYFDFRSDTDEYLGMRILPWETTVRHHLENHEIIMIYPQRGIFSQDITRHKNFTYIEIPEFYGIYHRFYQHTSELPGWSDSPSQQLVFLAKRACYSRQIMWYNIMSRGITGYVSFMCENRVFEGPDGEKSFENNHTASYGHQGQFHYNHHLAVQYFPELDQHRDLIDRIPYQSHPDIMGIRDLYGGWGGMVDDQIMYRDAFLCVVGETFIENPWDQIWTEKVFKPIWSLRPFILIGSTGSLSQLRALGFETFGSWIDESYDMENNFRRRMQMILAETNRLCALGPDTHRNLLNQMRPILEHNRENLAKLEKKLWIRQKHIAKYVMGRV